ncbi:MAG: zinc ABC transporter substrate-binding protein [Chloroflexales bacterium]|nr:zinc ABC transporter substrate-binding protein [Chloroflexales bacterium]
MHKVLAVFGIIAVLLLASCSGQAAQPSTDPAEAGGNKLSVVATTGQIADTVQNIAGDAIELTTLLGPGIDPHTYVATAGDITTFQNANVIFYNGLHLEAQMERVLEQIGQGGDITVVAVADQLDPLTLLNWEPEAGLPYDPHVWNDIRLWTQISYVIRDTLVETDPANAAAYEANATTYARELEELHSYMLEQVEQIPQERRVLVTAHDAFGYFGRAYGLTVEAIQGISTQSEASTADIQAMADIVVQRQVPAIFIETTISPRTIEAVKEAVQAQGQEVTVGGTLFSDAMGEPDTPEGTYIGMMRYNIDTIVAALAQ